jgi:hypothetical protein
MTTPAAIDLTEVAALKALRTFLITALPSSVTVVQGQANRVAQPRTDDFIVFWPVMRRRLGTNEEEDFDTQAIGSIAGNTLTVSAIPEPAGPIGQGSPVLDGTRGAVAANTYVLAQLSGSLGGTGTYRLSGSQIAPSGLIYLGTTEHLSPFELTVQCDFHGNLSGNYVQIAQTLWRSEYAVQVLYDAGYNGLVSPLSCDDVQQLPFVNDQSQVENRWTLRMVMQINPTVVTGMEFADQLIAT